MKHIHFIGIGGIGMSGIAQIMLEKGYKVSGSDIKLSHITERLRLMGAEIFCGHSESNVKGADTVVYSTAITDSNLEVQAALKAGARIVKRAEMLGLLMNDKKGIAVAGTHGKTTTTSMISYVFRWCGIHPTVIIGGELSAISSNAESGTDSHIIAEADESDASFLCLSPTVAVITNIDLDVNLNVKPWRLYRDDKNVLREKISETFISFTERITEGGCAVICADNKEARDIIGKVRRQVITYGIDHEADIRAENINMEGFCSSCDIIINGKKSGELKLQVPGMHNIQNALACIAVCLHEGLKSEDIITALSSFGGLKRRFEILGTSMGVTVVDDYAHNPSKIKAAIHAASTGGAKRIIAVCQPHRYSRTKYLLEELSESFGEADITVITEIYASCEKPDPEINGRMVAELIKKKNPKMKVGFADTPKEAFDLIKGELSSGDLVISMGAGDITKSAGSFYDELCIMEEEKKHRTEALQMCLK